MVKCQRSLFGFESAAIFRRGQSACSINPETWQVCKIDSVPSVAQPGSAPLRLSLSVTAIAAVRVSVS